MKGTVSSGEPPDLNPSSARLARPHRARQAALEGRGRHGVGRSGPGTRDSPRPPAVDGAADDVRFTHGLRPTVNGSIWST